MAGRRELERRLRALGDIGVILGVMKNLAIMETGKLSRILGAQREMVTSLEETASDFLSFYPQQQPDDDKRIELMLLVGSQRGLCGDFNDLLLAALPLVENSGVKSLKIAIGAKLAGRLQVDDQLDGPHAVEEISPVIHAVMDVISVLLTQTDGNRPLYLSALYHDPDSGVVVVKSLAPIEGRMKRGNPTAKFPPHLNLAPEAFFAQLTDQHLLAAITEVFHRSLMAESHFRLNHIEGASRRMERRTTELKRKQTLARQEEIIEEIEAILAGVGLDDVDVDGSKNVFVPTEKSCSAD
ncbi:MAG: F0F1 ATP synthase subunit gamma [Desulfuromonadaceae bacterium]|nr:F0F1 ATP synthase subunit gamma [Desulfuromonadaceae bacterium]MDD5104432.1 F0F1 ATP synthase subunit gamma [Desulfuromonadaceae bacterium]